MQHDPPLFIMMVGLPYSGKSRYAGYLAADYDAVIHSSDAIRAEILGDEQDQTDNSKVFEVLHRRVYEDLSAGKSVIFDATNISYKRRMDALRRFSKTGCRKMCCFMATPFGLCVERGKTRERVVPYDVLANMYRHIWIPQTFEGWDEIKLIYPEKFDRLDMETEFLRMRFIPHDNPHHELPIGIHCLAAAYNAKQLSEGNDRLAIAAFLHDIGKPFTKSFTNSKGEPTEIAHYYGHHHVSAYDSLFYLIGEPEERLYIASLIQWHMRPYEIEELPEGQQAGAFQKLRILIGDELYSDVMLLHQADLAAH